MTTLETSSDAVTSAEIKPELAEIYAEIKPEPAQAESPVAPKSAPEAADESSSDEEAAALQPGTLQAPLVTTGKRDRKTVDRMPVADHTDKESKEVLPGGGDALGDIAYIREQVEKEKGDSAAMVALMKAMYGRAGKKGTQKKCVREWSGVSSDKDVDDAKEKMEEKFLKLKKKEVEAVMDVVDVDRSPSTTKKEELVTRLVDWLALPSEAATKHFGKKVPAKAKRAAPAAKNSPKKKAKKAPVYESSESDSDGSISDDDVDDAMDDRVTKWVGHYVKCMDVQSITVKSALAHAEAKFGTDLSEHKPLLKNLLLKNL